MADEPRVEHAIVRRDVGVRLKNGEDRHRGPVFDEGQRQLTDGFHRFCATGGVLFKKLPIFPKAIGAPAAIIGQFMGAIADGVALALAGQKTPQQALDEVAAKWVEILNTIGKDKVKAAYQNVIKLENS